MTATMLGRLKGWLLGVLAMLARVSRAARAPATPPQRHDTLDPLCASWPTWGCRGEGRPDSPPAIARLA